MIIALAGGDDALRRDARAKAELFVKGKRDAFTLAATEFLIALYREDAATLGEHLSAMAKAFKKTDIPKCTVTLAGFYQLARLYLPDATFRRVRRPDHPAWFDEFVEAGEKASGSPSADGHFVAFPPELAMFAKALTVMDNPRPILK